MLSKYTSALLADYLFRYAKDYSSFIITLYLRGINRRDSKLNVFFI
jgi:hypothetical protein